ncbi:MAG: sensor histidine kinase [Sarcina sp.]
MFNKVSIRVRVTVITVLLLTICCIGLTLVLNQNAFRMAEDLKGSIAMNVNNGTAHGAIVNDYELDNLLKGQHINQYEIPSSTISAEQVKKSYEISSLMYMLIFISFGGILTYLIMGKSLKPLKDLSKEMKNTSIENLSKEIEVGKRLDEIYDLSVSFNYMNKRLNEAFMMQKRFSNSAAHELRTPLAVMRTKIDVFNKRKHSSIEDYDKLIELMKKQLVRLSDIVNSLLSLTNMEDLDISKDINLKTLVNYVFNDLSSLAQKKKIDINIIGQDSLIKGNYDLIYRTFYNLIENAIKYNCEKGRVDIEIKEKKVIIKDTGIGIPDEMKEQIFEAFFTVDKSRSRMLGGAGIGLSIVKTVIERHNGKILVENNDPKGSIFEISF